ncbi:MAG: hypothetical protein NT098_05440 [Candidatus Parcubacteria bacterium]|nr:hypothetical protein [Candidatus Parcubacteria bacterium]
MSKNKKIIFIAGVIIALGTMGVVYVFFNIEPPLAIDSNKSFRKSVPIYDVYKNGKLVAQLEPTPGMIVSRGSPPSEGQSPAKNSFLTASSFDPEEENNLFLLLQQAKDFNDYINLLEKNDYLIKMNNP